MVAIPVFMFVFVISFLALLFWLIHQAKKKEDEIYTQGIEAQAVVSSNEMYYRNGNRRYNCFVEFTGDDDMRHKGHLNVSTDLPIGRRVRIRYLSGKYENVVFVAQELD